MFRFEWSHEKNIQLQKERNISFQQILTSLEEGGLLWVGWNKEPYTHQVIFHVLIDGYVYLVPAVYDDEKMFLKTIIPSRKQTAKYRNNEYE